jgi:hypothetical protein
MRERLRMAGTGLETRASVPKKTSIKVAMHGVFPDPAGGLGTFTGTLSITSFIRDAGRIVAIGTLTGTLVDSRGQPLAGTARKAVRLPLDLTEPGVGEIGLFQVQLLGQAVVLSNVVLGLAGPWPGPRPACPLDSPET